jgi:hypothetical protein
MSLGGRHGHKVRELKRRIDAVLEEERENRRPPPPPISAEHAALRERIVEECKAMEWDYSFLDWRGNLTCTAESAHHGAQALVLMREERELLARHGVAWRSYDHY